VNVDAMRSSAPGEDIYARRRDWRGHEMLPLYVFHITAGSIGLLTGYAAKVRFPF
jgi:hypothetical protein